MIVVAHGQHRLVHSSLVGLAVQAERFPRIAFEVVVVDNGSTPPLADAIPPDATGRASLRFLYRPVADEPFQPASARNLAVEETDGELLLFLDGDCVPGPSFLAGHHARLTAARGPLVTLGHRVFVDGDAVTAAAIRAGGGALDELAPVASASNYGMERDRRLPELERLDGHPMPFNCCHGCNLGLRRRDLPPGACFDVAFDGMWGYEDIEFGHRMWRAGASFDYVPEAHVYHQEGGGLSLGRRRRDRQRTFQLACQRIPGFREFRETQARPYYEHVS